MITVKLDVYSRAFPSVTQDIRASVATALNPQAIVASIIDSTPGHPTRQFNFVGLPRDNYIYRQDVIDGNGNVLQNLAEFSVVPGNEGNLDRSDEQIRVGYTPGFDADESEAIFDGSEVDGNTKPNYVGWDIVPSELTGRGILVRDVDYSWDMALGKFNLLIEGDILSYGTFYNIKFNPRAGQADSIPTILDFKIKKVTVDESITVADIGKHIIIEPSANYLELTLPDISTVVEGRLTSFEIDAETMCCVKFLKFGTNVIKGIRGDLYALPKESFSIYKYTRNGVGEWRLCNMSGNFLSVGQMPTCDISIDKVYNMQLMDGSVGNIRAYARIYYKHVLELSLDQRVLYSQWSTGNNKTQFSLADANGNFRFPDRRGLYQRYLSNAQNGVPGEYKPDTVGPHVHPVKIVMNGTDGVSNGQHVDPSNAPVENNTKFNNTYAIMENSGTETAPKSFLTLQYILL